MENGTGWAISHIGSASLNTHSNSFILNQFLVVTSITKSLPSVQEFANDNNVFC